MSFDFGVLRGVERFHFDVCKPNDFCRGCSNIHVQSAEITLTHLFQQPM